MSRKVRTHPGAPRLAWAAAVGAVAGILSGLFGVGGGILIVPGLVFFLAMDQRRAHGTSLAAILPIALAGIAGYALEDALDWAAAGILAAGSAAGAVIGTRLLSRLSERVLRRSFAVFMLVAAVGFLLHLTEGPGRGPLDPAVIAALLATGLVAGVLAGLLGVGGGIVIVPALVLLLGVPDAVAKGTSLAVIVPTALVGTIRNLRHRQADLRVGAAAGLAGVAGAFGASLISVRLDARISSLLFATLLVAVAIHMLWRRS